MPVVLLLVTYSYLATFAYRGWIPHDAGTLALSAERVLSGELPHRDFDDMYTGGLSYLNAFAFQAFGVQLSSIRTVFFVFVMAFVLAAYWIAVRASHQCVAALVVLACVGWSVPNYFAALPSWYNVFFATFGLLSLLKYADTKQIRWLLAAGFWGGMGLIFKIVALYYIGAAIFFLIYCIQLQTRQNELKPSFAVQLASVAIPSAVSIVWLLLVSMLLRHRLDTMTVVQFLLPSVAVCVMLLGNAWSTRRESSMWKLHELFWGAAALLLGISVPIACFLFPFVMGGGIDDLIFGVWVTPQQRLAHVTYQLPPAPAMVWEIPVILLLGLGLTRIGRHDSWLFICFAPVLALVLLTADTDLIHQVVFLSVRLAVPVIAVLSVVLLQFISCQLSDRRRLELFLTVTMMAFLSLLQFPFAAPIYFCFVAPLAGLATQFLVISQPHAPQKLHLSILGFCLLFAFGFLNQHTFFGDQGLNRRDPAVNAVALPRAGLLVSSQDKRRYEELVRVVREHSPPGGAIYATPDCPEVYFLADRRNPTRSLFELFERQESLLTQRLELISRSDIGVVVINLSPSHSPPVSPEFESAVRREFPTTQRIDNFLVAVRDVPGN